MNRLDHFSWHDAFLIEQETLKETTKYSFLRRGNIEQNVYNYTSCLLELLSVMVGMLQTDEEFHIISSCPGQSWRKIHSDGQKYRKTKMMPLFRVQSWRNAIGLVDLRNRAKSYINSNHSNSKNCSHVCGLLGRMNMNEFMELYVHTSPKFAHRLFVSEITIDVTT